MTYINVGWQGRTTESDDILMFSSSVDAFYDKDVMLSSNGN